MLLLNLQPGLTFGAPRLGYRKKSQKMPWATSKNCSENACIHQIHRKSLKDKYHFGILTRFQS